MGLRRIVVMGVTGSGKTTIGRQLARRLGAHFVDGDDLHPQANIDKMAAGIPLDDSDRAPWLRRVRDELRGSDACVVACSALKRSYRDVLREAGGVAFVFLDLPAAGALDRVAGRDDHFMKSDMVASQFAALERPRDDETDVVTIAADRATDAVLDEALASLDG